MDICESLNKTGHNALICNETLWFNRGFNPNGFRKIWLPAEKMRVPGLIRAYKPFSLEIL